MQHVVSQSPTETLLLKFTPSPFEMLEEMLQLLAAGAMVPFYIYIVLLPTLPSWLLRQRHIFGRFDSARNSHTLKIYRVFPNPLAPDCRVPHRFYKHVSGGDTTKFNAITGIQAEFT